MLKALKYKELRPICNTFIKTAQLNKSTQKITKKCVFVWLLVTRALTNCCVGIKAADVEDERRQCGCSSIPKYWIETVFHFINVFTFLVMFVKIKKNRLQNKKAFFYFLSTYIELTLTNY